MTVTLQPVLAQLNSVILGKEPSVRLAVTCLLAQGHLLIEDLPGVGKTTLSHAIAQTLGLSYQRIQFTSDLLPADILGVAVFDRQQGGFQFQPGPIFAQLILADEINRATPKAQSALLEAMEERQVTTEGKTRPLPEPFFVIATQNPSHQIGTYPLPESQLDRFLMRISLGFPSPEAERELLRGMDRRVMLQQLPAQLSADELKTAQQAARAVHVSNALLDYLQALLRQSRQSEFFSLGLSPRAGLGLLHAAQAWAWLDGRDHVLPEDVQSVFPAIAGHRLMVADAGKMSAQPAGWILEQTPIP